MSAPPRRSSDRWSFRRAGWCRTWCRTLRLRSFRVLGELAVRVDDVAVEVRRRATRLCHRFTEIALHPQILRPAADRVAGALARLIGQTHVLEGMTPSVELRNDLHVLWRKNV